MIVGIPKEIKEDEYRVAITPAGVRELTSAGHVVLVEKGAGAGSSLPDDAFVATGAKIVDDPDELWKLGISVYERYNGPYTDELKPILEIMLHKRVAVKLNVERTVSWDHRKLGLPPTRPGS